MYANHCQNLVEVENGIKRIELDLRRFISISDSKNEYTYTKILSQLITCWAEVRILKVLYEQGAFSQSEIDAILHGRATLESKWKDSVELAFLKAYSLNRSLPVESQLTGEPRARYNQIIDLISNELLPSIQLRNRIAHGQWRTAFTSNLKNISAPLTQQLSRENIISLQLKKNILIGLALIIHDLAVSRPTFERDFDKYFRSILENRRNLHNRDYNVYKLKMIAQYQRGLLKRRQNPTVNEWWFIKIKNKIFKLILSIRTFFNR